MNTILLDSSSSELAIGLAIDNVLVKSVIKEAWQRQSEMMIPELDKLLLEYNIDRDSIDEIIVGIGPGSFTGVRISLTIAKVMAKVLNARLYAVSSLKIRKYKDQKSICILNARSNRSYVGIYEGGKTIIEDTIMSNDEILDYISEHKDYVICGEVGHLNLESIKSNTMEEMLSFKKEITPVKDINGLTPKYLKD